MSICICSGSYFWVVDSVLWYYQSGGMVHYTTASESGNLPGRVVCVNQET